jgi:hypothetical protein
LCPIFYARKAWSFSEPFSKSLKILIGREVFWPDIHSGSLKISRNLIPETCIKIDENLYNP